MRRPLPRAIALAAALALVAPACGDDDGATVRDITPGGASGSASASASAPASGSASASAPASGSASAPASGSASASAPASGSASAPASGSAAGAAAAATGSAAAASCRTVGDPASADREVLVDLDEWEIASEVAEVPAGTVAFVAENVGEEPHELVVVRAASPADLPVEDGQVQEDDLPEGALVGEIEAFPVGDTCEGAFDLEPGDYVLFCNILETEEDGTVESHYEEGMVTTLAVS